MTAAPAGSTRGGAATPVPSTPVPPTAPPRPSYFASRPHFAGLATTALLLPAYLVRLVHADLTLLACLVLLYGLGALLGALLLPRR